jgi:hypothetical protein
MFAAALLFVACQGCPPAPGPVVNPTGPDAAAPTLPVSQACVDFCQHGTDLGCPWAQPTPMGATCGQVCANNQEAAIAPWDLACRTKASDCNPAGCR